MERDKNIVFCKDSKQIFNHCSHCWFTLIDLCLTFVKGTLTCVQARDSLHLAGVFALFLEEGRRSVLPCVICWGLAALSQHLFTPPGDTTGQDSWCGFGAVWGSGRADMGVHVGGWDYRWAAVDGEGGREGGRQGGRAGQGGLWEELLSTKDTSARLNGQWPRTIRWMIMASTSGDSGPECVSVCVHVCLWHCQLVSQALVGSERIEAVALWMMW